MYDQEEYIGDGVYVSFDGWQVCLRAPRENGDHVVYLEPPLLKRLNEYVARMQAQAQAGGSDD